MVAGKKTCYSRASDISKNAASQRPASHAHFPYTARNFENAPRHPPVTGQQRAQTPPSVRNMSSYRGIDAGLIVTRVRVMLP